MCGLAGILGGPLGLREERLPRMLAAQAHRGPDGVGWAHQGPVSLGHQLLAISSVAGKQPLFSEDRRMVAVVNGELYGYSALKIWLESRGHRFVTDSDSELLVHGFEEEGPGFLERMHGEFAFLLWDGEGLWAGRDRFGIRPLCYGFFDGRWYFSSEAKGILSAGVGTAWNLDALFQALSFQYLLPNQTPFSGIHQLPPGTLARFQEGTSPVLTRYWSMMPAPARTPADLREALDQAVLERLKTRPGVRVATQLSGGIDSGVVAALSGVPAFTVAFDDGPWGERAAAEQTARELGIDLWVVEAPSRGLLEELPGAIAHAEGFFINAHVAAKQRLSKVVREAGFGVLLTGEGADELLWGYAHLERDFLAQEVGPATVAGIHTPVGEELSTSVFTERLGFVPTWVRAKASIGARLRPLLSAGFREAFTMVDPGARMLDAAPLLLGSPTFQSSVLWSESCLAGSILRGLGDACELRYGVEGRVPFLDTRVAQVAMGLPEDEKIGGGMSKRALREMTADLLSPEIRFRPKHPFMAPPLGDADFLARILRDPSFLQLIFFDHRQIDTTFRIWKGLSGPQKTAWDPVWGLLISTWALSQGYRLAA